METQEATNANAIAAAYNTGEILPLRSAPRAAASTECVPCFRTMAFCRRKYAIAGISRVTPYKPVGIGARKFSPIQAVAAGMSDSQNSSDELAQRMRPSTRVTV